MLIFGRKRIHAIERDLRTAAEIRAVDQSFAEDRFCHLTDKIGSLEARISDLEAKIAAAQPVADLESLARDMMASIPAYLIEATGEIDNKRRVKEAFEVAREWVAQRSRL